MTHVNAIAGRLSLRKPQRDSLEILDHITEMVPPRKSVDLQASLAAIESEYPTVTDFEREFPSLCFALATGVGKTRLMGAFISFLYQAHGLRNFFVLAPNLTIYNKLIADFTPNTPKYVFTGIAEFATEPPIVVTGDNYQSGIGARDLFGQPRGIVINIFNISKINSEVRGGKAPRIKRLSEYIGQSYFDYLAGLEDLVLIMDESHRYRASSGARAINELKPVLGLELTATPFVETGKGPVQFKNVILDYPLARAMQDGFVKEPAVVTQKNFDPSQFTPAQIEEIKLQDGVRLHENTKVELETYARQTGQRKVKPFMLIIARDTTHAGQLMQLIQSEKFFEGRYKDKVIQVDSSRSGAEEDEMVARLLAVESTDEPTEIVIHVNMLKEGWDVTNLYTIVPLRAANARTLIEQSIGRGLRLPYGKRTGVKAVDRLSIVAHDKFQEIVDEANRPDSAIRLEKIILEPERDLAPLQSVTIAPLSQTSRVAQTSRVSQTSQVLKTCEVSEGVLTFNSEAARQVGELVLNTLQTYERLPQSAHLLKESVQAEIVATVQAAAPPAQPGLPGIVPPPDIPAIVAQVTQYFIEKTIDIPRITVVPTSDVTVGYHPFALDCSTLHYQPVERDLLLQALRTHEQETLSVGAGAPAEQRLEDYLVRGLMDFDDISYDDHADLLYDLARQVVARLHSYLKDEADVQNVLVSHQKQLAAFIHAQMLAHQWEEAAGYEVKVSAGFTTLKSSAATAFKGEPADFRAAIADKSRMGQMVFGGFARCLYPVQKFHSDTERRVAVILDRDSLKWFRPAKGQFQMFYKWGSEQPEYVPDFVAETADYLYLLESKARNEMIDADVLAKQEVAVRWCSHATQHALENGGKPWKYALIPHDAVAENMTLKGLAGQFVVAG